MKRTEKRMKYYNLSENIIACKDFLPQQKVEELYTDLLNNRNRFNISKWGNQEKDGVKRATGHFLSSRCTGLDFWMNWEVAQKDSSFIAFLKEWFFHQGFYYYAEKNGSSAFNFMCAAKEDGGSLFWKIHVVSYNNGGYYNWHRDAGKNLFTFNLILNKGDKLEGGNMLFMDNGKIIEVENQDNFMVVIPSFIPHAITPLYSKNNKEVSFLEQRFSLQFWVGLL